MKFLLDSSHEWDFGPTTRNSLGRETLSAFFKVIQLIELIFICSLVCKEAAKTDTVICQNDFPVSLSGEPLHLQFIFLVPFSWASCLYPLLGFCGSENIWHNCDKVNIKPINFTWDNRHNFFLILILFPPWHSEVSKPNLCIISSEQAIIKKGWTPFLSTF